MDWDDTKYFLAIARDGQMLSAAKRMQISQARLSRRLQSLETSLGTRLFDRSTKGCELTDEGRLFLETAERIEAEMLSGLARLGDSVAEIAGTVRIGAPDGLGSAYISPRLGRITEVSPKLRIQLVPLPRNFSLSEREADIAIMIGRPTRGRLRCQRLADYTLGLYAHRSYIDAHGTPDTLDNLHDHPLIGYVDDLVYTEELNYAAEFLSDWSSTFEVSTAIGQFEAVRSGAGIGILHDFMTAGHPDLIRLFPEKSALRSYWAVWHENLRGSNRVSAVVDFLRKSMQRDAALFRPDLQK